MATMSDILGPGGVISRRLPGYEARPSQVKMAETVADALRGGRHAVIEGGTGVGKALDVDTPIATPAGWTRMGDLRSGDIIFDASGTPTTVVQAFEVQYGRPCFEIAFSDGSTLVADADHEWITHTWRDRVRASRQRRAGPRCKNLATSVTLEHIRSMLEVAEAPRAVSVTEMIQLIGGRHYSVWKASHGAPSIGTRRRTSVYESTALLAAVLARLEMDVAVRRPDALPHSLLTTREIAATLTVNVGGTARLNHAVPVAPSLELPDVELPIHPYVLGLWLGDGSTNTGQLTTADPELVPLIEEYGYTVRKLRARYLYSLHLPGGPARSRWKPGFVDLLHYLGVRRNKHIPPCYLRASEAQRRALLAGLLDTDGTVSVAGAVQYTSTSARLIGDVQALVRGLGYRASVMTKSARLHGKDCGTAYTITFTTCDQLFRLPRKAAVHKERLCSYAPARNQFRYITAVRTVPSRPVRCIQVAAPSHLYLAGEALIPTHNSLAYLVPAIYSGKRVIVSTANKALQDQLVTKDIPFLQHALPREVSAALAKGRSNYLCLDRFDDEDHYQAMSGSSYDYRRVKEWAAASPSGDFEDLDMMPSRELVARINSTTRTCIGNACVYFHEECFVEKMRARAAASKIVVCNHALLLSDLVLRDMGAYLLPDRDAVIVDEAHRLEDAAVSAFTVAIGRRDFADLMDSALLRRYVDARSLAALPELVDKLMSPFETAQRSFKSQRLDERLHYGVLLADLLGAMAEVLKQKNPYREARPTKESRRFEKLIEWVARLSEDTRIVSVEHDDDAVRFVERPSLPSAAVTLTWAPIDVSKLLGEILFKQTPVICTSATLAVGDFRFFKASVGIDAADELTAPSPFNYGEQCLLYVPSHLPEFSTAATPAYTAAVCAEIERLVSASEGRAFLLFTSYRAMHEVYDAIAERLPYTVLKQGEAPRPELLRRFRTEAPAVLFATKSFWEGVDVVGEALSLVVIDRMPFGVPDDPIVAAKVERLKREGGDWFNDLMLPSAVIQLKQGFGRLIRSRSDRGVVAILDSRLMRKAYGQRVIRALPPARLARRFEEVEKFFADV